MKVKELIEELQKLNQEDEVIINYDSDEDTDPQVAYCVGDYSQYCQSDDPEVVVEKKIEGCVCIFGDAGRQIEGYNYDYDEVSRAGW